MIIERSINKNKKINLQCNYLYIKNILPISYFALNNSVSDNYAPGVIAKSTHCKVPKKTCRSKLLLTSGCCCLLINNSIVN